MRCEAIRFDFLEQCSSALAGAKLALDMLDAETETRRLTRECQDLVQVTSWLRDLLVLSVYLMTPVSIVKTAVM